ncbi:Serine/threonine-protein kinase ATR [Apostasia shenzhenica]|uniref:Serine/threonine-protein kinase ATR n=1 Tax=Apostasia shenzhenica TaxID=1088818 RepID=A0A2I0A3X9_9ASPA|nr:Serine/threonine-protein kinase ATR [Apostasia shenzhenica]
MANLSTLIHELRERIAASSSSSSAAAADDAGEDPLEVRFRVVLPNLLHAYVVPSSSGILQPYSYSLFLPSIHPISNKNPPVLLLRWQPESARSLPSSNFSCTLPGTSQEYSFTGKLQPSCLFSDASSLFSPNPPSGLPSAIKLFRHELIFETAATLLSLLRTGERDAYRLFFLDAMVAVEDISSVASLDWDMVTSRRVSLKCFSESLAKVSASSLLFSEIPVCCRPEDGEGIVVEIGSKTRWESFATWVIRLMCKCLTEGTLYLEGLMNSSVVSAACSLFCYGDAKLHMACFDFVRITMSVVDAEIIPVEKMIRSIVCILQFDHEKEHGIFRNPMYDSSVGACLHILHSSCQDDIVESTASEIVSVFSKTLETTESTELQMAMCNAYIRIAKICPIHIWKPAMLISMICYPETCLSLIECIRISIKCLDSSCSSTDHTVSQDISPTAAKELEISKVGEKRSAPNSYQIQVKRQRAENIKRFPCIDAQKCDEFIGSLAYEQNKKHESELQSSICKFLNLSEPDSGEASPLRPETSIMALRLALAFPDSFLSFFLDVAQTQKIVFKKDSYLDGGIETNLPISTYDDLIYLLKLPWRHDSDIALTNPMKIKCLAVQVLSKVGALSVECNFDLLDMAITDEVEQVRVEAAAVLPMLILYSGYHILGDILRRLEEAFSAEIICFLNDSVLELLFMDGEANVKTKEQKFLDRLKHALAGTKDPHILVTLLETIAQIMNSCDIHGQLFFYSLVLLVDQLDNGNDLVRLTASNLIQRSCYFQVKGGLELILSKLCHVRDGLYEYFSARLVTRPSMIREFAETVLGIKIGEFIGRMVPSIIPQLIISHKNNDQALITMHELANHLDTDVIPLVVNWLPKVLAFALLSADGEQLTSVLQFYHFQTGSDNKEIFAAALPALLDELLCFPAADDCEETNRSTARIPMVVQEISKILTGSDELPSFLKNHFVRLLNSIDRKMLHADDIQIQKQALRRIEKLIEMMGSYLSTHVPKIMVLLLYAIEKEALQSDGLSVLHVFVKQLAILSPSSIKHVISQIVAAFIPCLERYQEEPSPHLGKIVEILEDLVVKNRLILKQQIRELPLLPGISVLSAVNKVIENARGSLNLREHLQDATYGLNHESLNVRYMMACELSKLLNARREDVTALVAGEAMLDLDVISSLITSLLRGCGEQSRTAVGQRLKLVCADCLGALGAVDPAKFKGLSCQRFKIECSDDDLIFELINKHLSRAFRAASDTVVQDSAALAIQELLKLVGCQASLNESSGVESLEVVEGGSGELYNEMNKRGQRFWDRFSNYIKEIIAPCLTSRFQLPSISDANPIVPIYCPSMSFRRWIFFWIRKLTAHATGPRFSIFSSCRGIVRHDMQTAIYLLPYLVLNAVCHGTSEARHSITEEILSVLDAATSENSGATVQGISGGQNEVCIQAVFTLLDNLGQWVDDLKQEIALFQSSQISNSKQPRVKDLNELASSVDLQLVQCSNVSELLSAIPKVTLSKASLRCHAHARALMYFESHVREKCGSFNPAAESSGMFSDDDISFLMEIYSSLDEPDGLLGLANLRKSSTLQDQLIINEKAGNWAEVLTYCEQALQMEPDSVQRHFGVLNCLLNMCHLQAMVTHVDGLMCRIPQYKKTWCMHGVQAAWRLGKWDLMDEYLSGAEIDGLVCGNLENNASFDLGLAKIIQAMMKKDHFLVAERIAYSKQALLVPLAAAGMDSYMRAYPYVVKLHMLCELEDFNALLGNESFKEKSFSSDDPSFARITKDWDNRLRFTQPSLWAREPLLALRRLVFGASNMVALVGNCWLQYAKLCRSAGHYETAYRAILEANASGAPKVNVEKAKLLWSTRKSDSAISELEQSLLNMPVEVLGNAVVSSLTRLSLGLPNPPSLCATQVSKENQDVAKTILLYTRWIHYTGQKQKEDIINLYSRVRELQPKWEKSYFFMAKYCDDLLVDARKRQEDNLLVLHGPSSSSGGSLINTADERPWWSYLPDVLLFYAKGLHKGHKNLFQALPRLLTLWFEFGSMYHRDGSSSNKTMKTVHTRVLSIMRGCLKDLPTYQWLTVLSQLVSRICHQNEEIVRIVKHIITSVLQEYPQQALWMMAAVSKSTVSTRRDAAAEIIQAARKGPRHGSDNSSLFVQFAGLIDHLIKLCFHPGQPKARKINISTEFSALKRMMPLEIILPIQLALTVTLPSYDSSRSDLPNFSFSAADHPTISGIADEAEILSSLQRPKKVVFLGSDGVQRPFLCKPKDDLRKDARMMEFTAMINHLLSKFPESRRRKLHMRTFAVIPLTEDCGMVEWVPYTRGLRHILQDIYITCGKFDRQRTNPLIKRTYDQFHGKMPDDEVFKLKILPMFPPVFHRWFLTTFSEPAAWFRARVTYAQTTAVWSMVGHIVGLGDRHGENILFDSTTGDCVHVDFSCLFDKGLQLEKPELVPFRLTQVNMIDGLGITGYEGVFLKVCEITLSVLRTHKETLMSVLETFIHDPLVEWTKSHKSSGTEVQNPHAQRAMSNIKARLEGVVVGVGAAPSLPLAVEGQARRLIAEAVSHKNLGKMYIWWMPWF